MLIKTKEGLFDLNVGSSLWIIHSSNEVFWYKITSLSETSLSAVNLHSIPNYWLNRKQINLNECPQVIFHISEKLELKSSIGESLKVFISKKKMIESR